MRVTRIPATQGCRPTPPVNVESEWRSEGAKGTACVVSGLSGKELMGETEKSVQVY